MLDEHYARVIAERLRELGHDVECVKERPDLVGGDDHPLFTAMMSERRAILTEDSADFHAEMHAASAKGATHYGVVFTSPRSMPRSTQTIGLFVDALDDFLQRHPEPDALLNASAWLVPRP